MIAVGKQHISLINTNCKCGHNKKATTAATASRAATTAAAASTAATTAASTTASTTANTIGVDEFVQWRPETPSLEVDW